MTKKPQTIIDFIYQAAEQYPEKIYIKYKDGDITKSFTYKEFVVMIEKLSGTLYGIGLRKGDKVGIISDNSWKWMLIDQAILSLGAADVPRGSDSNSSELVFILKHSDSKICFVENAEQADKVLPEIKELEHLKTLILINDEKNNIKTKIPDKVEILHLNDLLNNKSSENHIEAVKSLRLSIKPEDLATLIYTSGTTGIPKGVMLSHDNIVADIEYMLMILDPCEKDRWVSVLPIWHVYERTVEYAVIASSGLMAYSKPVAKQLLPVLAEIRPTWMVSVPRIWESLYNGIMIQVKGGSKIKQLLFNTFLAIGLYHNRNWKEFMGMVAYFKERPLLLVLWKKISSLILLILVLPLDFLGNILVYSKIRKKIGGKMKTPISGGGKLPDYLDDFFNAIKINILEGYGMTETSPVICVRTNSTLVSKTVGRPIPHVEVMIGDENFTPLQNQCEKGLIYVKGRIVMKGYYKDPENTLKILKNEWLNTGDLGRKTISGEVQILGRAKETIVLTGGENIEPFPIEEALLEHPLIKNIMIVGQDQKYLAALVIPDEEAIIQYAKNSGLSCSTMQDICNNQVIIDAIHSIIKERITVKNGFKPYENIKYIKLIPKQFEIGAELTRSLKMKRNVITELYEKEINQMFK